MQAIKISNTARKLIVYISIFFMLFASDMVTALLIGNTVKYAFWAWGIFLLLINGGKFSYTNMKLLCGILLLRAIIVIAQLFGKIELSSATVNSILGIALFLNTIMQTATMCTPEEYANAYINILTFISSVSLICFGILMSPLRNDILRYAHIDGLYIHNYFHLWGWNNNSWRIELFTRNAGPWWEPGAFQCFITIAMLMILSGRCKNPQSLRTKFLILAITWITIQSTTGYLIMGFVYLMMFKKIMEIIFQKPYDKVTSKQKMLLILCALIALTIFLVTLGYANISEKLSEENGSSTIRFNDVFSSLKISMIRPLTGLGEDLSTYYSEYNIVNNSAALLVTTMQYGYIYLICFLLLLYRGIKEFFAKEQRFNALGALLVMMILCMTEGIVELPIIFIFFPNYHIEEKSGNYE